MSISNPRNSIKHGMIAIFQQFLEMQRHEHFQSSKLHQRNSSNRIIAQNPFYFSRGVETGLKGHFLRSSPEEEEET